MGWSLPAEKVSPQQEFVVDELMRNLDRPQWLRGFAGSGKTILMIWLAERLCALNPNATLCFVAFTHSLADMISAGSHRLPRDRVQTLTHDQFLRGDDFFTYVFVDEAQDICTSDLLKIQARTSHFLLVGDPDQTIYDDDCSGKGIFDVISPRVSVLTEIFRLTPTLLRIVLSVNPAARGAANAAKIVGPQDSSVRLLSCDSREVETRWIFDKACNQAAPGRPAVILFPNHLAIGDFAREVASYRALPVPVGAPTNNGGRHYGKLNEFWADNGVPLMYAGSGFGSLSESDSRPVVYLMTLHAVKGLDFDSVFLPGMTRDVVIWKKKGPGGDDRMLRRLLFVALTRSRADLFISFSGSERHYAFADLPEDDDLVTRICVDSWPPAFDNDELDDMGDLL